jgi:hypothetical protein
VSLINHSHLVLRFGLRLCASWLQSNACQSFRKINARTVMGRSHFLWLCSIVAMGWIFRSFHVVTTKWALPVWDVLLLQPVRSLSCRYFL